MKLGCEGRAVRSHKLLTALQKEVKERELLSGSRSTQINT